MGGRRITSGIQHNFKIIIHSPFLPTTSVQPQTHHLHGKMLLYEVQTKGIKSRNTNDLGIGIQCEKNLREFPGKYLLRSGRAMGPDQCEKQRGSKKDSILKTT
jgi:hypothetical protein